MEIGMSAHYESRMRIEGKNQAFGSLGTGVSNQPFDYFAMAGVHAVKRPEREYGFFVGPKFGYGSVNVQGLNLRAKV